MLANIWHFRKNVIGEQCKGEYCADLGESFQIDPNSNEYLLAKFGLDWTTLLACLLACFDTAENERCKVRKFEPSGI